MKWIWPFSWYVRVRELTARVQVLEERNRQLQARLRVADIRHSTLAMVYANSVAEIARQATQNFRDVP